MGGGPHGGSPATTERGDVEGAASSCPAVICYSSMRARILLCRLFPRYPNETAKILSVREQLCVQASDIKRFARFDNVVADQLDLNSGQVTKFHYVVSMGH